MKHIKAILTGSFIIIAAALAGIGTAGLLGFDVAVFASGENGIPACDHEDGRGQAVCTVWDHEAGYEVIRVDGGRIAVVEHHQEAYWPR